MVARQTSNTVLNLGAELTFSWLFNIKQFLPMDQCWGVPSLNHKALLFSVYTQSFNYNILLCGFKYDLQIDVLPNNFELPESLTSNPFDVSIWNLRLQIL